MLIEDLNGESSYSVDAEFWHVLLYFLTLKILVADRGPT